MSASKSLSVKQHEFEVIFDGMLVKQALLAVNLTFPLQTGLFFGGNVRTERQLKF
jgi:hypothetical protein